MLRDDPSAERILPLERECVTDDIEVRHRRPIVPRQSRPRLSGPAETARALPAQRRPRIYPHALHGRHLRCASRVQFFFSHLQFVISRLPTFLPSFSLYSRRAHYLLHAQPDEFLNEQYALRQILYQTPRRTELFIVLTMYNVRLCFIDPSTRHRNLRLNRSHPLFIFSTPVQEDEVLFCRTMHGVMSASCCADGISSAPFPFAQN